MALLTDLTLSTTPEKDWQAYLVNADGSASVKSIAEVN